MLFLILSEPFVTTKPRRRCDPDYVAWASPPRTRGRGRLNDALASRLGKRARHFGSHLSGAGGSSAVGRSSIAQPRFEHL